MWARWGVGEALKYPLLLFSASVETVPRIQEAEMDHVPTSESFASSLLPDVDSLNPVTVQWLLVFKKRANLRRTLGEPVSSPIWLIIILILAFLFKRPNLLRTLLNEHVKSFQIKDKPVCMYVHFNLWEIILWSRVPSAIMPLLTSVVSQPPPSNQYFATYFLRSWSKRTPHPLLYLFIY